MSRKTGPIILLLAATIMASHIAPQHSGYKVDQITEFVRHGARTTYNSLLKTNITQLLGQSELTPNGIIMHYILGRDLRRAYPEIFKAKLTNDQVNIYVSPIARCIQSAVSQLLGLFPNREAESTLSEEGYLPPFTTIKRMSESSDNQGSFNYGPFPLKLFTPATNTVFSSYMGFVCPNSDAYRKEAYLKKASQYEAESNKLSDLVKAAGFDPNVLVNSTHFSLEQLTLIYDELEGFKNFYKKFIPGFNNDLYLKLMRAASFYYVIWYGDEKFTRLVTSNAAKAILKGLEDRVNGGQVKFNMYTGHNSNMNAFALQLGLISEQCTLDQWRIGNNHENCLPIPAYASNYIFELNKKDGEYFVRTLIDGKPRKICDQNQDEFYCAFSDFKKVFEEKLFYNYGDFAQFCGNPKIDNDGNPIENQAASVSLIFSFIGFLLIGLCLFFSVKFARQWTSKVKHIKQGFSELEESNVREAVNC